MGSVLVGPRRKRQSVDMAKESEDTVLTGPEESAIVRVAQYLAQLSSARYYGKVTIVFETGQIRLIRQEQTIRPDDLEITT